MNNKNIITSELDFDLIKTNLKEYLKGQSEFSDYNFEGSGLSVLLDILAYNTHYNALYTNLAINESFLDSASKRASVVSIAKLLGYTPNSATCATAKISLSINAISSVNKPGLLTLPKYSTFTTNVDNTTYTLYTLEDYHSYIDNDMYIFTDVIIKEGVYLTYKFLSIPGARYIIPNPDVDITTLRVKIKENAETEAYSEYTLVDNIIYLNSSSKVYFIKEIENGLYELQFGNGIIGAELSTGNVIEIDYLVTHKRDINGAKVFSYTGSALLGITPVIYTQYAATGGDVAEDIDHIRFNAPRLYSSQNRCVTKHDYESVILSHFPQAKSVNVWGGEENFPPSYGDVFISILPTSGLFLSDENKDYVLNEVLKPRKSLTIHNKLVEPSFIEVELNTAFYYDSDITFLSQKDILALVFNNIKTYSYTELEYFGRRLKYSRLSNLIDNSENSITNNITKLKLYVYVDPMYNIEYDYTIDIGNPVYKNLIDAESIISNGFYIPNLSEIVYIDDIPNNTNTGTLRLFYYKGTVKITIKNIGTIDYNNGILYINNLVISKLYCGYLRFKVIPSSYDVVSTRNQIIRIPDNMIYITAIKLSDNTQYKFTPSRI